MVDSEKKDFDVDSDHWSYSIHCHFQNAYGRIKHSQLLIKPMPEIALLVLNDAEMNAYATKFGDGYGIMLNSGLYHAVNRLFRTLLAHPSTFLSIGNFLMESNPESAGKLTFSEFVADVPRFANRIPEDETRLSFADHLTDLTMRFVIEHELGHILAGHLDFDPKITKMMEIADHSGLSDYENFGIEMHADEIAFFHCVFWIVDSLSGREPNLPKRIFIETADAQLQDLYVSTYALFQIFSHLSMSTTHPNPLHRQIRLGVMLDWICTKHKIQLKNQPVELVAQAMYLFNEYMETVFLIDWSDRQQETENILRNGMDDEIAPYSEMVTNMFPLIKDHAYVRID